MTQADKKIIVYIDMDDTLCDFKMAFYQCRLENPTLKFPQSTKNFFFDLEPITDAIETFTWLNNQPELDVYLLSAPSLKNPNSYTDKRLWVEKHLGFTAVNQLIISPHKNLNKGHYLIDDNISGKGQENFEGELIQFGSDLFPSWIAIHQYFKAMQQQ
jgi:5'(3')-deoxyribonucleotidase